MSLEKLLLAKGRYHERMERASQLRAQAEVMETAAKERLENAIAYELDFEKTSLTQVWKSMGWSNDKVKSWAEKSRKRNRVLLRRGTM